MYSARGIVAGCRPASSYFAFTTGSAITFRMAAVSTAITGSGVLGGAAIAYQFSAW